jgi:hypothetical protein
MSHCDAGWHQTGDPADPTFFRFGARLGRSGTLIYRVGAAPDDRVWTIWCYGDNGVPWTCTACGWAVSGRFPPDFVPPRWWHPDAGQPRTSARPCRRLRRHGVVTFVPQSRRRLSR